MLQRNRNVQAVLETKQNMETQKLYTEIKKSLQGNGIVQLSASLSKQKLTRSKSSPNQSDIMNNTSNSNKMNASQSSKSDFNYSNKDLSWQDSYNNGISNTNNSYKQTSSGNNNDSVEFLNHPGPTFDIFAENSLVEE